MSMPSSQGNKLDQYSIAARGQMRVGHKAASWAGFATAAGATLAMSGVAEASIVYSGTQNITLELANPIGTSTFKNATIDIDGDKKADVVLALQHFTSKSLTAGDDGTSVRLGGGGFFSQALASNPAAFSITSSIGAGGNSFAVKLSSGQNIGPAGNFGGASSAIAQGTFTFASVVGGNVVGASTVGPAPWALSSNGFVGIQFTRNGADHYGWIRLAFEDRPVNSLTNGLADKLTIVDWAWESEAGISIEAGAAPEPTPLALLAAGAVGIGSFRRKRKAATTV